jgi:hypothetical protein
MKVMSFAEAVSAMLMRVFDEGAAAKAAAVAEDFSTPRRSGGAQALARGGRGCRGRSQPRNAVLLEAASCRLGERRTPDLRSVSYTDNPPATDWGRWWAVQDSNLRPAD